MATNRRKVDIYLVHFLRCILGFAICISSLDNDFGGILFGYDLNKIFIIDLCNFVINYLLLLETM